jgi:hypothetical protein
MQHAGRGIVLKRAQRVAPGLKLNHRGTEGTEVHRGEEGQKGGKEEGKSKS